MMHENQYVEILPALIMAISLEKKERTVKGNRRDLAKDFLTVKSIFSLENRDEK